MGEKLTKTARRALEWFADREYASMFGPADPRLSVVGRLRDAGLLHTVGSDPGTFGFIRYAITPAGRALLKGGES